MSIRIERPTKVNSGSSYEEPSIRWADDVGLEMDDGSDSISSEEQTGSEYDVEQRSRAKPVQEIWDNNFIFSRLETLPDSEGLTQLINNDDTEEILKKDLSTALLLSAWLGNELVLKKILRNGASVHAVDEGGRTALHLACLAGNIECVKLLIQYNSDIGAKDTINKATPLHCAASKGNLSCLRMLLRYGADVNAGLTNKSALHYAVQSLAVDCVKELLDNEAIPNTPQVFSETPLHVAATMGSAEIMKLLLTHGAAVNVQYGLEKLTPLHLAAEEGDVDCVRLLIESGAQLSSENHKRQTPLHLAALSQCSETIELLLSKGANPNAKDKDGRTPLHCAIVKMSRSCECVKVLLNALANVNQQDSFGYTPLHLAALNEISNCVMLLLNYGGDVTIRTNGGISVLTFITRKTPDVIPKYLAKFDAAIRLNDHEIGDVDCEVKLDFRILVPTVGNKETELLLNFIEVGHREVLTHPLCETFLFLKWRRIRKFFLFSLMYHSLFVLFYSYYVIGVYVKNCPHTRSVVRVCAVDKTVQLSGYLLLLFNVLLLCKEMFQIFHLWFTYKYMKQWENWLQWMIIITVFCSVHPKNRMDVELNVDDWQHHVAAIGIFLAWVELMIIVGRFPIFGLYIQMFTTVSFNFFKFVAAYVCLLVAFALSFGVLFANYKSFSELKWVFLKVLVMMSGELEYEDIFYDDSAPIVYEYSAQIMFLAYVILVTVILTNLMVGLAVSDIQGLQQSAGLDRLVRQAELVAHLESMLFSKLLKCVPHKLMHFFHKQALLLKSQYHWALYIKPNDPREERIPKDLIKNIYHLIVERKDRPRSKRRKFNKGHYDFISPPLSRVNSESSTSVGLDKTQAMLRVQLDEMIREFNDYGKAFKQKIDQLNQQVQSTKIGPYYRI